MSNWIVFREKSDNFLKRLWLVSNVCWRYFSCDLWGFWWVERKCMLDGVHNVCWRYFRIYLLHLEARRIGKSRIIFWLYGCTKSQSVKLNCVSREVYLLHLDSFLKSLWFSCDLWGFWWVEIKCMLDGVHNVCWRYFRIYWGFWWVERKCMILHLEARSLLIGKSQSVKLNCVPREVW